MKILNCRLTNFGSYEDLSFNFEDIQGCSLIHGATGSGKSTLFDAVCWALYGVTAKNGSVDDVRSWTSPDTVTKIWVIVQLSNNETILIERSRGKPSQNDLYWEERETVHRGKDLADTQKLLNERLGVDSDLFLMSSYFCEFSPSNSFFTAKSKDQRELLEYIAPLELPALISVRASEEKKSIKKIIDNYQLRLQHQKGQLSKVIESLDKLEGEKKNWELRQSQLFNELAEKANNFDKIKNEEIQRLQGDLEQHERLKDKEISDLERQLKDLKKAGCPTCGNPNFYDHESTPRAEASILNKIKQIKNTNHFQASLEKAKAQNNHYFDRLEEEKLKTNPIAKIMCDSLLSKEQIETVIQSSEKEIKGKEHRLHLVEQLYGISFTLRGELLKRTVSRIQDVTNYNLETYFESEFKVSFSIDSSDSLQIEISKNGYDCVFKQLSKGQRALLKLCFSLSIMEGASSKSGTHFDTLFFDEALDGLDTELKVKAFNLFESLSTRHNSVFVIDHSTELKSLFNNKFKVLLESDSSRIEEDNE